MHNLTISEAEFDQLYRGLVDKSVFVLTESDSQLRQQLLSKLWRLNNLYTIVNKDGERVPFRMNHSQHIVYAASLLHPRLIILKSRQQGISTFWLIAFLDDALTLPDFNIGLMAQGKSEASTLLKRVKLAWDTFPSAVKEFFSAKLLRDNTEELSFSSGATLFIRTSFRSATLQRLHISEYGKIANATPKRALETKTGTLQAIKPGNTTVIESTAEGDNDFKHMWQKAIYAEKRGNYAGKDFKPVFLSWLDDPDCQSADYEEPSLNELKYFKEIEAETKREVQVEQRNFWIAQYREIGDAVYQEYPATPAEAFMKVNNGAYYGVAYHNLLVMRDRIVPSLHEPMLDTYVAMDLGVNDTFVLLYFQYWESAWRVIDEYTNTGEGLAFYVDHMNNSGYNIARVFCPHDIRVKELGTGKTRLARLRELGVESITVLPRLPILDGIERVRAALHHMWIDSKCTYTMGCLQNYSKEWDDKHAVWKAKPLHDNWSNGADALRYLVTASVKGEHEQDSFNQGGFDL